MSAAARNRAGDWRHANVGRFLSNALRRFEARVLELMTIAGHTPVRLSLVSVTRNLDVRGTRIVDLARRGAMTKQAMSELVRQCEAAGLVARGVDPLDRRAQLVVFTSEGLAWLEGFETAVRAAEAEMGREIGAAAMSSLISALDGYGRAFDPLARQG